MKIPNSTVDIDMELVRKINGANEEDIRTNLLIEECAELIQALIHKRRGRVDNYKILEEMADVEICIRTYLDSMKLEDPFNEWVEIKSKRTNKRMDERYTALCQQNL